MGDVFDASGSLSSAGAEFAFSDVSSKGGSAVGNVSFVDPASGVRYASNDTAPCVFQFAPSTNQVIEAGRIWVQFDCSKLISEANPLESCSSRYGYVLVENCGK